MSETTDTTINAQNDSEAVGQGKAKAKAKANSKASYDRIWCLSS